MMKGNVVLLQLSVVSTAEYNIMENSDELIGTTEHLKLEAGCRIN
jgi:hypothetical protein